MAEPRESYMRAVIAMIRDQHDSDWEDGLCAITSLTLVILQV